MLYIELIRQQVIIHYSSALGLLFTIHDEIECY
jgi:hypothetical protein